MKGEKLYNIKKELAECNDRQLSSFLIQLAKHKKENKELLSYLLYYAGDPMEYAESLKSELETDFTTLQKHHYYSTKTLRKILRILNRHIKYTGSKQVEAELLLWFSKMYIKYADLKSSHGPLRTIFTRQLEKVNTLIPKLHEDLQFDYLHDFNHLLQEAEGTMRWFRKEDLKL